MHQTSVFEFIPVLMADVNIFQFFSEYFFQKHALYPSKMCFSQNNCHAWWLFTNNFHLNPWKSILANTSIFWFFFPSLPQWDIVIYIKSANLVLKVVILTAKKLLTNGPSLILCHLVLLSCSLLCYCMFFVCAFEFFLDYFTPEIKFTRKKYKLLAELPDLVANKQLNIHGASKEPVGLYCHIIVLRKM